MIFTETRLAGAFIIEPEMASDERGYFARVFSADEFTLHGLKSEYVQWSISFNHEQGTLRGLHYQISPHQEAKIVRCTMGSVFDVMIDMRPRSPTHMTWRGTELTAQNRKMVYVPEGFAHGFQTLEHNTEVCYQISEFYHPESSRGIRWNDPALGISWPLEISVMSLQDQSLEMSDGGK